MSARALRALLVANDGLSAGHVTRALAVARALQRRAPTRGIGVQILLATTSEADVLLASEPSVALVRLPAPAAARRAGLSDQERRRLVRACIESAAEAFAPDLVVADTFPSGPHGELAGLVRRGDRGGPKRALLRRAVPAARLGDDAIATGVDAYDLTILAGDPDAGPFGAVAARGQCVHVAPITATDPSAALPRAEARARLGIPDGTRAILLTAGGGGDLDGRARLATLAAAARRVDPVAKVVVAGGPLAKDDAVPLVPLAPWMAAFDGAIAAAGYNTACELALAGVPAALFACPRAFDDQAGRAERFARAGWARVLSTDDDDAVASALAWMREPARASTSPMKKGGADDAADALLDLAMGHDP